MRSRTLLAGALVGGLGGLLVAGSAFAQALELNFGTVNDPGGMQYLWPRSGPSALTRRSAIRPR
jgi:hypothetical protein